MQSHFRQKAGTSHIAVRTLLRERLTATTWDEKGPQASCVTEIFSSASLRVPSLNTTPPYRPFVSTPPFPALGRVADSPTRPALDARLEVGGVSTRPPVSRHPSLARVLYISFQHSPHRAGSLIRQFAIQQGRERSAVMGVKLGPAF